MLPVRYQGYTHAFRDILKEEGVWAFYRGFPLHMVAFYGTVLAFKISRDMIGNLAIGGKVEEEDYLIYRNSI